MTDHRLFGYPVAQIIVAQVNKRYGLRPEHTGRVCRAIREAALESYTEARPTPGHLGAVNWGWVDHVAKHQGCPSRYPVADNPKPLWDLHPYEVRALLGRALRPENVRFGGTASDYLRQSEADMRGVLKDFDAQLSRSFLDMLYGATTAAPAAQTPGDEDPMNQFTITQTKHPDRYTVVDVEDASSFSDGDLDEVLFAGTLDDCTDFIKSEVAARAEAARLAAEKAEAERKEREAKAAEEAEAARLRAIEHNRNMAQSYLDNAAKYEAQAPQA